MSTLCIGSVSGVRYHVSLLTFLFYLLDVFHFDKSIKPYVWLQHLPAKSSFKVK